MVDRTEAVILLDIYGKLLTERQREVMLAYYEEDLSLGEIAENLGISRPGVHDLLQRSINQLILLEEQLNLVQKEQRRREVISQVKSGLDNFEASLTEMPAQAREILEEIRTNLKVLDNL